VVILTTLAAYTHNILCRHYSTDKGSTKIQSTFLSKLIIIKFICNAEGDQDLRPMNKHDIGTLSYIHI